MSPRMLNVREAMVQYLMNNGWAPASAELMSWAVHPIDKDAPTSAKSFQKDIRRRADLVGQRGQGLDEQQAVRLAIGALVSYQRAAADDGNQPLAEFWGAVLVDHADPVASGPTGPTDDSRPDPTAAAPTVAAAGTEWLHPVTLPPGRLAQLGSTDGALEPVGPFATTVLAGHLLAAAPGLTVSVEPGLDRWRERAALAGYLVDLDLAGVAAADVAEPDGPDLLLADVRVAVDHLGATDLGAIARRHSPAAEAVLRRLVGDDDTRLDGVARSLGAGLCLAAWRRGRA